MEQINFYAEDGTKLNGFLHKSKETTQDVILSIHGMSSNCFKERDNVIANTANNLNIDYFCFNNRGSELVKYITKNINGKKTKVIAGTSYEEVLDSYYDIVGAILELRKLGYKNIYLQGHSLGCTKIIYTYNKLKEQNNTEILEIIKDYVKESIDFINDYNLNHRLNINGQDVPVINAVDLFNEIVSFEKNANGEYFNILESKYGITMDELLPAFDYALQNKPEGVNFLYNEPFLENDERRKEVLEVLGEIDSKRPGLIDTLGSQMHITIGEDEDKIRRCFEDFRTLQERTGKHIQITEFDMSLGRTQIPRVFGNNPEVTLEQVYEYKHQKIGEISSIISESGVHLDGISYWSLTDGIDCNLERVRSNYLADGSITDIHQIPSACGGLFPTHKKLIKKQEFSQAEAQNFESAEPSHKHR